MLDKGQNIDFPGVKIARGRARINVQWELNSVIFVSHHCLLISRIL